MILNTQIRHAEVTQGDLLTLAGSGSLVPSMWYWVTDATPDGPLYAYAVSQTEFVPSPSADRLVRAIHTAGLPIVISHADKAQIGTMQAWNDVNTGAPTVGIIGSSHTHPEDIGDLDKDVTVAGQEISLIATQVKVYLPGAEVGGTIGISAVDGNMATLVAIPKVEPAYSVFAQSALDVPIPATDTWTVVVTGVPPDFPTTGQFDPGDSIATSLNIENAGSIGGSVDIVIEAEEDPAGSPGVWTQSNVIYNSIVIAGSAAMHSRNNLISIQLNAGANVRMAVKANAIQSDVSLGVWAFSGDTIGSVTAGQFHSDAAKIKDTDNIRLANVNDNGEDMSAALADLEVGSNLEIYQGIEQGFGVISAVTPGVLHVDIEFSLVSNVNKNWEGDSSFSGKLVSAAFTPVVKGTVYAQNFTASKKA